MLYSLEQCAGLACDYERRLSLCKLLRYNSFGFGKVAWVYNCNAVYADSVSECLKVNSRCGIPAQRTTEKPRRRNNDNRSRRPRVEKKEGGND